MFHVCETASPVVALVSCAVPLSHSAYCVRTYKSSSFELLTWVSFDHHLVSDLVGVILASLVSRLLFWRIRFCFLSLMYCQSARKDTFSRASRPNTSCVGVALVVVCTKERTACRIALRTPDQPKVGSTSSFPRTSLVRIMSPTTWWIRSMMAFDWGLRVVMSLRSIPYSFRIASDTSAANSLPRSMRISVGHGYRVSQVCSKTLAT